MNRILTLFSFLLPLAMLAQSFPIGSRQITFFDASRNRNIGTQVRYPGVTAGSNADVAAGEFPVLVMGHGFAMEVGAYANLWNNFVPKGYIMVLPTTEGGLIPGPNHGAFGQDLRFLAEAMQEANNDPASPFFGRVAPATALMGHSMGGGASFLGSANNTNIQALVNFAPAETNPSAIAAAPNVLVPTLVFAASNDCVTPIAQHQGPMYNALTVGCRAFVNITGGGHCYFANSNFNCDFGEITCSPNPTISRAAQQSVVNDFAGLWLDHFLKGEADALAAVLDSIDLSDRVTGQYVCALTTGLSGLVGDGLVVAPVPADDLLRVKGASPGARVQVIDPLGRQVVLPRTLASDGALPIGHLPPGTYRLLVEEGDRTRVRSFSVLR